MSVDEKEALITADENTRLECRACLQKLEKETSMFNIFEAWPPPNDGMGFTIADDLAKLANIQILETDGHSKIICEECCKSVREACKLVVNIQKNDLILRQRYPRKPLELNVCSETVWPKPIQLDKNIDGTVYENTLDVEIKQEVVSEDEYSTNINGMEEGYRETVLDNFDIKIEPEELIEPQPMQITVNGTISLNQLNTESSILPNGNETYENEEFLEPVVKEEPVSEEEDVESVSSDLPLECMLCAKVFKSVTGLKAHVIAQHSYKTVKRKSSNNPSPEKKQKNDRYVCATCRRSFVTSTDLMVHETCHNKAICYGCNQKFDTFDQLTKHRTRCKAINSKEVQKPKTLDDVKRPQPEERPTDEDATPNETLKCSMCDEQFIDAYYMKIHQEIHHSVTSEHAESADSGATMETETLESIFSGDK